MANNEAVKNLISFRKFANIHLENTSPVFIENIWKSNTKYYMVQEYRYFLIFKKILEYFPDTLSSAVDLGCYPGDIGILLRNIYGKSLKNYGCGLNFTEKFKESVSGYYDMLLHTELDPENPLADGSNKTIIDLPDNSIDLIVAGEIFEHLYNPLHFISECARIVSEKGIIILTTDNLKYIGNILGMLRNKTPFSELKNSHIFLKSEWRPHERLYFRHEIAELFRLFDLEVKEHFFFDNHYEKYEKLPFRSRINQAICKMFYINPEFRPRHLFVFSKANKTSGC